MKILVGVDGSACSVTAIGLVASLRRPGGTQVTPLAAYEVPIDWTDAVGSTMDWIGDVEDATGPGRSGHHRDRARAGGRRLTGRI